MKKRQRKSLAIRWFYISDKKTLIFINFNFDFLGIDNVYFENYFASEHSQYMLYQSTRLRLVFYIW